jgi:Septum formation
MRNRRPTTAALGSALLLALLAAGACGGHDDDEDASADGSAETTSPEAEDETVFALEVGDCLAADPTGEQVSEVPTVDCAEPHVSEVFHTTAIDAEELPSAAEIEGIVEEECFAEFESFVGMAYESSALEVMFLQPSDESWEQGDRELVCMITDPAGQSTGTLEGANR